MANVDKDWRSVMLTQYSVFGIIASLEVTSLGLLTQVINKATSVEKNIFFLASVFLFLEISLILWLINQERKTAFSENKMFYFRKYEYIFRNTLQLIMIITAGLILFLFNLYTGAPISVPHIDINWTAVGSVATFSTLIYFITREYLLEPEKQKSSIKAALINELRLNVDLLFSGQVERPSIFFAINKLRENFISDIQNEEAFKEIQELYAELEYYQTFVEKVYFKIAGAGAAVTEKQLDTCNKFIAFFGDQQISFERSKSSNGRYIDPKRNLAIDLKNKKINEWGIIINNKVNSLF